MHHSHLLLWQKARDERREETATIHSFIPLKIEHKTPGLGQGMQVLKGQRTAGCSPSCWDVFRWLDKNVSFSKIYALFTGSKEKVQLKVPFNFTVRARCLVDLWGCSHGIKKIHCTIHSPWGYQPGSRSGSYSGGTEAVTRPLPAGSSGGAMNNSVKIKP